MYQLLLGVKGLKHFAGHMSLVYEASVWPTLPKLSVYHLFVVRAALCYRDGHGLLAGCSGWQIGAERECFCQRKTWLAKRRMERSRFGSTTKNQSRAHTPTPTTGNWYKHRSLTQSMFIKLQFPSFPIFHDYS